jgi:hypothetical protein
MGVQGPRISVQGPGAALVVWPYLGAPCAVKWYPPTQSRGSSRLSKGIMTKPLRMGAREPVGIDYPTHV